MMTAIEFAMENAIETVAEPGAEPEPRIAELTDPERKRRRKGGKQLKMPKRQRQAFQKARDKQPGNT